MVRTRPMHLQSFGNHVQRHCRARANERYINLFSRFITSIQLTMSTPFHYQIHHLQFDRLDRTLHIRIDPLDLVQYHAG